MFINHRRFIVYLIIHLLKVKFLDIDSWLLQVWSSCLVNFLARKKALEVVGVLSRVRGRPDDLTILRLQKMLVYFHRRFIVYLINQFSLWTVHMIRRLVYFYWCDPNHSLVCFTIVSMNLLCSGFHQQCRTMNQLCSGFHQQCRTKSNISPNATIKVLPHIADCHSPRIRRLFSSWHAGFPVQIRQLWGWTSPTWASPLRASSWFSCVAVFITNKDTSSRFPLNSLLLLLYCSWAWVIQNVYEPWNTSPSNSNMAPLRHAQGRWGRQAWRPWSCPFPGVRRLT